MNVLTIALKDLNQIARDRMSLLFLLHLIQLQIK